MNSLAMGSCPTYLALLALLSLTGTTAKAQVQIAEAPAGYPRALQLANGTTLACAGRAEAGEPAIALFNNASGWSFSHTALRESEVPGSTGNASATSQLANCYLATTSTPGTLLLAYRHHSDCDGDGCSTYRIGVSRSDDGGATFGSHAVVIERGIGVWEPFIIETAPGQLLLAYSLEHSNGGDQDIVTHTSDDDGKSWSSNYTTVVSSPGDRHGMPGIAPLSLSRGTELACVFETGTHGHFVVNVKTSDDGGASWNGALGDRQLVYRAADSTRNAGAPQIATLDGGVAVSFMTNEDSQDAPQWPQHANSKTVLGASSSSADLKFDNATATEFAPLESYWPSLFVADGHVWAAYQFDGAAFQSEAPIV